MQTQQIIHYISWFIGSVYNYHIVKYVYSINLDHLSLPISQYFPIKPGGQTHFEDITSYPPFKHDSLKGEIRILSIIKQYINYYTMIQNIDKEIKKLF